jgi:hypothetical protein
MEIGNKQSLMGLYFSDMVFPQAPPNDADIIIPKLFAVVTLVTDVDDRPERIRFIVNGPPGRSEIARLEVSEEQFVLPTATHEVRKFRAQAAFPLLNLPLKSSGLLEVLVETEKGIIIAGRLKIVIPGRPEVIAEDASQANHLIATVSSQPSERSPSGSRGLRTSRAPRRPSRRRNEQTPKRE